METGDARLMVRHGGTIQRSSDGGRRRYVDGETKLVKVRRSASLRKFHDQLAAAAGCFKVALHYVRPDDPDALRDVVTDDDVRHVLAWALLRDLLIQLYGASSPEKVIPRVRVFVVSMDVRSPLPEWLFAAAPTAPIAAPSSSPAPPAKATMSPSSLRKRSVSAPSPSAYSANDTSRPPSPSRMQRSASASRLTSPSRKPMTRTTAAAAATRATQQDIRHYAAMQRGAVPVYPAPVFLVPVYPSSPPKRIASAPSLSAYSAEDTSNSPSPSLIQRSASASRITPPLTNPIRTTTAATSTRANREDILHYAAPFPAAMQRSPAPVFLVPVAPAILYQPVIPVIPVYQGFLVPAGCRNVVVLCAA